MTSKLLTQNKELEDQINDNDNISKEINSVDTSEFDDITLPDGTVIPNISEEVLGIL